VNLVKSRKLEEIQVIVRFLEDKEKVSMGEMIHRNIQGIDRSEMRMQRINGLNVGWLRYKQGIEGGTIEIP